MAQSEPTLVISEFMADEAVASLSRLFDVHYDPGLVDDVAALKAHLRSARAVIVRNRTQVDPALLDAAPHLQVVGRLGVGLDNINLPACAQRHIEVIPATGANARAVAEYVMAAGLMLCRGSYFSTTAVASGAWPRAALSDGQEVYEKTLGILGFGGIGRLVAQLAHGLGMRTLAHDPALASDDPIWQSSGTQPCDLPELLERSDILTLHIPLVPATRHLFNAGRIAAMRPGSVLINTSRGGIVDESALAQALKSGHLRGAALDVFEQEPLAASPELQGLPNLILTPHIAGVTAESNERVSHMIAERVAHALQSTRS